MRPPIHMSLARMLIALLSSVCPAQSWISKNYAGLPAGVSVAATRYAIGSPAAVASDGVGGFYVVSPMAEADLTLSLFDPHGAPFYSRE